MTEEQRAARFAGLYQQAQAMSDYLTAILQEAIAKSEADWQGWQTEGRPSAQSAATSDSPTASPNSGSSQTVTSTGFYRVFKTSPTANADFFGIRQDSGANQLGIFDNDFDPDDDVFLLANVTAASYGTLEYTDNAFTFRYTPVTGFFGSDSFTYTIANLTGGRATATVTVFVSRSGNNPPAIAQPIITLPIHVYTATVDALASATDPDGDPVSLVAVTTPRLGTVTSVSGQLAYTHPQNYFGADTFDYFLTDGRGGLTRVPVSITQVDSDNDGMPDEWETLFGLDPTTDDSNADPDGDGLPNLAEYKLGTNPRSPDNPLNLDKIASGQAVSGYARIPLSLNPVIQKPAVQLLMNGDSADAALQQGADGGWYFTWDTGYLANGNYTIGLSFQFKPDAQPPTPGSIAGQTKSVRVANDVTFDQINSEFSTVWHINVAFPYQQADWRIELYDEDGSGLVYFAGTTTDGTVHGSWDLTDTGQGGQQISFGNILSYVYVAPAGQGLPPVGSRAAAQATRWFSKEVPGGIGDTFVVAWGWDAYSQYFEDGREATMLDGVINIIGNPGLNDEYTLRPGLNGAFCCAFRYDDGFEKEVLRDALKASDTGNFFWFGHGADDNINGNPLKSTIADVDVENWLQNKAHRSKPPKYSYGNKHPYRLVILNGCQTYSSGWANAFGIDYSAGGSTSTVTDYLIQRRQAQAFVGWTKSVVVPASQASSTDHLKYAEGLAELFGSWMAGFTLDNCLQSYAQKMHDNGFDGHDSWRISGAKDLFRSAQ